MALKQKARNLEKMIANEKQDIQYYSKIVEKSRKRLAKFEKQLKEIKQGLTLDRKLIAKLVTNNIYSQASSSSATRSSRN